MEEAKAAFTKVVREAVFYLGKGFLIRKSLHEINQAIVGARDLGIIPMEVARFSKDETAELGLTIKSYSALKMKCEIREMLVVRLRERGVPAELLESISTETSNRFS